MDLLEFPVEVKQQCLHYLSLVDLATCALVCKDWYMMVTTLPMWESMCRNWFEADGSYWAAYGRWRKLRKALLYRDGSCEENGAQTKDEERRVYQQLNPPRATEVSIRPSPQPEGDVLVRRELHGHDTHTILLVPVGGHYLLSVSSDGSVKGWDSRRVPSASEGQQEPLPGLVQWGRTPEDVVNSKKRVAMKEQYRTAPAPIRMARYLVCKSDVCLSVLIVEGDKMYGGTSGGSVVCWSTLPLTAPDRASEDYPKRSDEHGNAVQLPLWKMKSHDAEVRGVVFTADVMITVGVDVEEEEDGAPEIRPSIKVWSLPDRTLLNKIYAHKHVINGAVADLSKGIMVTHAHCLKGWDISDPRNIKQLWKCSQSSADAGFIKVAHIYRNVVFAGCQDDKMIVADLESGKFLRKISRGVGGVQWFETIEDVLLTGSRDFNIRVWHVQCDAKSVADDDDDGGSGVDAGSGGSSSLKACADSSPLLECLRAIPNSNSGGSLGWANCIAYVDGKIAVGCGGGFINFFSRKEEHRLCSLSPRPGKKDCVIL